MHHRLAHAGLRAVAKGDASNDVGKRPPREDEGDGNRRRDHPAILGASRRQTHFALVLEGVSIVSNAVRRFRHSHTTVILREGTAPLRRTTFV